MDPRLGQRRSFDGNLCTIRYVGEVAGTSGDWLGVEWDDPTRGKHSGEHRGVRYFTCKSNQPTAGSFVRPSRPSDKPRGFLEALREKYASEFEQALATKGCALHDSIEISGKVVEEVGFDKIRKQLAELQELKIVLLDGLCVAGLLADDDPGLREREESRIGDTCPKITELDLSRNLLSRWDDLADICGQLKRLRVLKLNANRFESVKEELKLEGPTELHLDETLLPWDEISTLTYQFPSLTTLSVSTNQISTISTPISATITSLKLEHNEISSLSSVRHLTSLPNLEQLSLRGNNIDTIYTQDTASTPLRFPDTVKFIDLSRNKINSWTFINDLLSIFPGLQSLRISGNPLYNQPMASTAITTLPELPMTVDESYMLTLARLSTLTILNYSKITAQDRQNGELYYLSLIAKELSAFPASAEAEILAKHPRYTDLCQEYGDPVVTRAADPTKQSNAVHPRSVAARLVKMELYLSSQSSSSPSPSTGNNNKQSTESIRVKEIPRSFDTYQVKAIVGRLFDLPPFQFRLVWETDELDPVSQRCIEDGDDWDSDEEDGSTDGDANTQYLAAGEDARFVKREVELVDSTRDIGAWFDGDIVEAKVRVEV